MIKTITTAQVTTWEKHLQELNEKEQFRKHLQACLFLFKAQMLIFKMGGKMQVIKAENYQ